MKLGISKTSINHYNQCFIGPFIVGVSKKEKKDLKTFKNYFLQITFT
jgi:hypothetical protein